MPSGVILSSIRCSGASPNRLPAVVILPDYGRASAWESVVGGGPEVNELQRVVLGVTRGDLVLSVAGGNTCVYKVLPKETRVFRSVKD
jgi:CBS domain-containing protein